MDKFKVIIVEAVPLELKGTLGIVRSDIPEAEVIGTADTEPAYWRLLKQQVPDLVLLDLGLGGSTTVGVEICRHTKELHPHVKVLIFTGEILNEKLWVDVLDAGADGIILKTGELLTRRDVSAVMDGKQLVFNEPILEKIVERFKASVSGRIVKQEALVNYEIDEYDERFLRHLALGYTKEQITELFKEMWDLNILTSKDDFYMFSTEGFRELLGTREDVNTELSKYMGGRLE